MPVVEVRNTDRILHFLVTSSSSGIRVSSLQLEDQMGHVATMTGAEGPNLLLIDELGTGWGKPFSFIVCASAKVLGSHWTHGSIHWSHPMDTSVLSAHDKKGPKIPMVPMVAQAQNSEGTSECAPVALLSAWGGKKMSSGLFQATGHMNHPQNATGYKSSCSIPAQG